MNKEDLIGGDCLKGIHEALALVAPDLRHHIVALLRKPATSGPPAVGESIYHQYFVSMRVEDASAIFEALREIEKTHGFNKTFNERQINLLVCTWHKHVERLRTQSSNEV
jgi:hypothetical protein